MALYRYAHTQLVPERMFAITVIAVGASVRMILLPRAKLRMKERERKFRWLGGRVHMGFIMMGELNTGAVKDRWYFLLSMEIFQSMAPGKHCGVK